MNGLGKGLAVAAGLLAVAGWTLAGATPAGAAPPQATTPPHPAVIVSPAEVTATEPGPHDGGGTTTAYRFSDKAPNRTMEFRQRTLHPGSTIGLHPIDHDEVYYILSGHAELTAGGKVFPMGPGMAVYLYAGDVVALKPVKGKGLSVVIAYPGRDGGRGR